jgi:hypothetical protein
MFSFGPMVKLLTKTPSDFRMMRNLRPSVARACMNVRKNAPWPKWGETLQGKKGMNE